MENIKLSNHFTLKEFINVDKYPDNLTQGVLSTCAISSKIDNPPCAGKRGEVLLYSLYFIDISLLFRDLYVSLRLCLLDTSARQNK